MGIHRLISVFFILALSVPAWSEPLRITSNAQIDPSWMTAGFNIQRMAAEAQEMKCEEMVVSDLLRTGVRTQQIEPQLFGVGDHKNLRYCLFRSNNNPNNTVLFFLHGLWQHEQQLVGCYGWMDQLMRSFERRNGYRPHVVTISMGYLWRMQKNLTRNHVRPIHLIDQFILPEVEREFGPLSKEQRVLFGESMGAYNSALWAIKRPDYFSRVALSSPAMSHLSPFSNWIDFGVYVRDTGAQLQTVLPVYLYLTAESWVTDRRDWFREEAPLDMVKAGKISNSKMLILASGSDEYGFQYGDRELYNSYKEFDPSVRFEETPGGHCSINPDNVARFLNPLNPL